MLSDNPKYLGLYIAIIGLVGTICTATATIAVAYINNIDTIHQQSQVSVTPTISNTPVNPITNTPPITATSPITSNLPISSQPMGILPFFTAYPIFLAISLIPMFIAILFLFIIRLLYVRGQENLKFEKAHNGILVDFLAIDQSMLRLVSPMLSTQTIDKASDQLAKISNNLARDIANSYPDTFNVLVLLHDEDEEYLKVWGSHGFTSTDLIRFYIGDNSRIIRGCAGHTYKDKKSRLSELEDDGTWRSYVLKDEGWTEDQCHMNMDELGPISQESYLCIPILVENTDLDIKGVFCISSRTKDGFRPIQNPGLHAQILVDLGSRFTVVLQAYEQHIRNLTQ